MITRKKKELYDLDYTTDKFDVYLNQYVEIQNNDN